MQWIIEYKSGLKGQDIHKTQQELHAVIRISTNQRNGKTQIYQQNETINANILIIQWPAFDINQTLFKLNRPLNGIIKKSYGNGTKMKIRR